VGSLVIDEKLKSVYRKFKDMFERELNTRNLIYSFDRAWIALHCIDMCVYKHYVVYFSLGYRDLRDMWNRIAEELLKELGAQPDPKEALRTVVKIGDREMKMSQIINMFLVWYFSEREDLCRLYVENIKHKLKLMSDYAKKLLRVLALDRELMTVGSIVFDEKWLGEHYKDRIKEVYGEEEVDMKKLEIAVVELNKIGLIMYCNIAIRDFEKLDVKVINEYYIAPHLAPIWRNVDKYLD